MNLCGHSARLSSPTKKDRDNEDSLQADNVIIGFELLFGTIEVHQEGLQSADKEENLAENEIKMTTNMTVTSATLSSTINEMVTALKTKCPRLAPSIFLTGFTPVGLNDLCSTDAHLDQVRKWVSNQQNRSDASSSSSSSSGAYAFVTDIDFPQRTIRISKIRAVSELDATLVSLEKMMRLLVLGGEDELNVAMTRFLQANGYTGNLAEERHIINEVYNLAYAIKVLMSNTPGMKVTLAGQSLPLEESASMSKLLSQVVVEQEQDEDNDDEDENEMDEENFGKKSATGAGANGNEKKRKRKRGKTSGGVGENNR